MLIIYKITNTINNKIYIGKTKKLLQQRWAVHQSHAKNPNMRVGKSYFHNAIRKYGVDAFLVEILDASSKTQKDLANLETLYIKKYRSYLPEIGYNIKIESG